MTSLVVDVNIYRTGATLTLLAVLAGCSGGNSGVTAEPAPTDSISPSPSASPTTDPSPTTSASTAPTASPDEVEILDQYRQFFASLTPLSTMAYEVRYAAMRKLAVDPELTRVMGGYAAADQAGEVLYGEPVVRPEVTKIDGPVATVSDCQDTSAHGRQVEATGKKTTVGRKGDLATVTMQQGSDDVWRIATISYAPAGSCVFS